MLVYSMQSPKLMLLGSRLYRLILLATLLPCLSLIADVSTSQLPTLAGTEIRTITSKSVGDDFVLYVLLPPEAAAEPERTFPIVYALDGDHTFPIVASAKKHIGWSGTFPPIIIVGIGYGTLDLDEGNHRSRDLSPQPYEGGVESGGGARFHRFLIEEAFPYIEAHYPADPENRYLFGHSLGGLFGLYCYAKSPASFKGIIAGSPYLDGQLELLAEVAGDTPPRSCKLLTITGEEEDHTDFIKDLEPLQKFLETKWAQPDTFEIVLLPGYNHFTMVAASISKGLEDIFED